MDGLIAYALAKKYADQVGQSILDAGFKVRVEQDRSILNRTGEQMTLYFVPKESSLSTDTYDEYIYTTKWEFVGSTDVNIDYNQLKNKPKINQYEIKDRILLNHNDFNCEELVFSDGEVRYDISIIRNHVFCYTNDKSCFFSKYRKISEYMPVSQEHYEYLPIQEDGVVLKFIDDKDADPDTSLNYKLYWIYIPENEGSIYLKTIIKDPQHVPYYEGAWRKISGGSQITSGVVNQNGTITFTDSTGNVVDTTGDKLVTSGNQQISMGYDNGGFYFLFDDGQEVVNNGSN